MLFVRIQTPPATVSHMPSLRIKRACLTLVLPSQSLESEISLN